MQAGWGTSCHCLCDRSQQGHCLLQRNRACVGPQSTAVAGIDSRLCSGPELKLGPRLLLPGQLSLWSCSFSSLFVSSLVPTWKSWPVYSLGSRPHHSPEQARTKWEGLTGILAQSKNTTLRLLGVKSLYSALCSPHSAGGRPRWDLMSKPCRGQLCICSCWLVLSVFLQSDGCFNSHPEVY